jgi:two-component system, sensor histidine kinase PdtaS
MKTGVLFLLLFSTTIILCQIPVTKIDSLQNELLIAKTDNKKAKAYLDIGQSYMHDSPDKSFLYADSVFNIARKINSKSLEAEALILKANGFISKTDYISARKSTLLALEIAKNISDYSISYRVYNTLGNIESDLGNMDIAMNFYFKADSNALLAKDTMTSAKTKTNIGINYMNEGNYYEGLKYLLDALEFFSKKGANMEKGVVLTNLGAAYHGLKNFEKCIEYSRQAEKILIEHKSNFYRSICLSNIGSSLSELKRYDEAEKVFKEGVSITDNNDKYRLSYLYHGLGSIYTETNKLAEAEKYYKKCLYIEKKADMKLELTSTYLGLGVVSAKQGNRLKAKEFLIESEKIAKAINAKDEILKAKKANLVNELHLRNLKELGIYTDSLFALSDAIFSDTTVVQSLKIDAQYNRAESEQKAAKYKIQNLSQQNTIERQNYLLLFLLLAVLPVAFGFYTNYKRRKEEEQYSKVLTQKNKQIELLNSERIHRIKNNLQELMNGISFQSRQMIGEEAKNALKDNQSRIKAVALLHDYLEISNNDNIDGEIDLRKYLGDVSGGIQTAYSDEKRAILVHLDSANIMADSDFAVRLAIIINELATNSIKHAFKKQDNPSINVRLYEDNKKVYMEYRDNGDGISEKKDNSGRQSSGLKFIDLITQELLGKINYKNQNGAFYAFEFQKTRLV